MFNFNFFRSDIFLLWAYWPAAWGHMWLELDPQCPSAEGQHFFVFILQTYIHQGCCKVKQCIFLFCFLRFFCWGVPPRCLGHMWFELDPQCPQQPAGTFLFLFYSLTLKFCTCYYLLCKTLWLCWINRRLCFSVCKLTDFHPFQSHLHFLHCHGFCIAGFSRDIVSPALLCWSVRGYIFTVFMIVACFSS